MLPQLVKLKGIALDLLFPQYCVGCGKEGDFLCYSCRQSLPKITPPLCPSCVAWQAKIDGIRSPFRFDGVMRQAIHQLKYRNLRALVMPLAKMLQDYLIVNPMPVEVLVAVPLHPKRLRERGYNQSSLLAQELKKLINLPLAEGCLIRRHHTSPQARTTTVAERRRNTADAFVCRDHRLRDRTVLLIDDVSTSGATLDACAAALRDAGASSVWGLVVAREI